MVGMPRMIVDCGAPGRSIRCTARVLDGFGEHRFRRRALRPRTERFPDRRFDRRRIELTDDVEPRPPRAVCARVEVFRLRQRVALDHVGRSEIRARTDDRHRSRTGTSRSASCCGLLCATARFRDRLVLRRASSASGNAGLLDDVGDQFHHRGSELAQHVAADRGRIAADADPERATHPSRFPSRSRSRCAMPYPRESDHRSDRPATLRSRFSNALPVRTSSVTRTFGMSPHWHQRDLESVVEREASRLRDAEVARRARLRRLRRELRRLAMPSATSRNVELQHVQFPFAFGVIVRMVRFVGRRPFARGLLDQLRRDLSRTPLRAY